MTFRFVTFLTDFGLQDEFVGTCHGVIKSIAPDVEIIDITHGIDPQRVLQGALVLANTVQYMPVGVHLAVVDPGVGSRRRPLALESGNGRLFVGPDNGLLVPAAEKQDGIVRAVMLENRAYALESVSRTFHGRDLFAPAAAHLALGVPLEELGPPVAPEDLVRIALPEPRIEDGSRIHAVVVDTDRFGNIQLNLNRAQVIGSRHRAGQPGRGGARGRGVLRRRCAHVHGRASRRHHPLRGRLPELRARDQRRRRGGDVRRHAAARRSRSSRVARSGFLALCARDRLTFAASKGVRGAVDTGPDVLLFA